MLKTCPVTGRTFTVSPAEMALRKKLGVEGEPELHPIARWQILGAFWQHWALHKRKCDKTGKQIVSVFSEDCPYPVWHKDEWIKHANPPSADIDLTRPLFPQMWELFRRCPIAHNMGANNENCEYTDDMWYGRNCYMCHSGHKCEDLKYCYRDVSVKSSQFCVFSFDSELCCDLIFSHNCFRSAYLFHCWQCSDSAFLYDCRNCNHCMFCTNLRNKSYCFGNEQLTREAYEKRIREWDLRSRAVYERCRKEFIAWLQKRAWHRALFLDLCQNCSGNLLYECKDCENCFFITNKAENCINLTRSGVDLKDAADCISLLGSELIYCSSCAQDQCYDVKFGYNLIQCKFMEYCAQCFQCQECFGCCGLVGKKHHIFNKPYSPEEYKRKKAEVIAAMQRTSEYGKFFPAHFAANPYEESLSGFYWPLTRAEGERRGFRMSAEQTEREANAQDASRIPDRSDQADESVSQTPFWDPVAKRPFQILKEDVVFAQDVGVPLPYTSYMRRIQDNYRLIPYDGTLRTVACGKCKKDTLTGWSDEYDGRILCEECYLKEVY
ncbi:MAG: hypothetical protein PHO54_02450 [Candidatus Peribacteraceae bacterium]|nr:hypothetical protein [Candidatus Peribacteraceae bacterium]